MTKEEAADKWVDEYAFQVPYNTSTLPTSNDFYDAEKLKHGKEGFIKGWEACEARYPNKLYAFLYNPMTEESGYITISLHQEKKNAEVAMELHKGNEKLKWEERHDPDYPTEFGSFEDWRVQEVEIKP